MRFELDIKYSPQKMKMSRKRMEARADFKYYDRVPVNFCVVARYFAPIFDIKYSEIFKDVETHYYWLLQFEKYRIENIPEDHCLGKIIYVHPYFDNVIQASAFGAGVKWPEDETLQSVPVMENVSDIESFEIPEADSGLWGKTVEWWQEMKKLAEDTEVTFNGEKGKVEVAPLSLNGLGPHMIAIDLAGHNFYLWQIEYPEACHQLLDKITKGIMKSEKLARKIDPRPRGGYGLAEDTSTVLSPEMFKEFVVPYDKILYNEFGQGLKNGRGMHMCGPSTHLHKALIEDLEITSFDIFGYQVEPETAARNLGERSLLWGNINPMLMLNGTRDEVKEEALSALEALAPCGGFMLGDGANVCPGTPLENLAVLTEAAEEHAQNHPQLFPQEQKKN